MTIFRRALLGTSAFLAISTGCIGYGPEEEPSEFELLRERIEVAAEGSLPSYQTDAAAADANFFAATGGQIARTSDSSQEILAAVRSGWNGTSLSNAAGQTRGAQFMRDAADFAIASEITKLGAFVAAMTVLHSLEEMDPALIERLGVQNFWTRVAETNVAGLAATAEVERFLDECEGPGASFEAGIIDGKKLDASLFQGLVYSAGDLAADVLAAAEEADVPTEVTVYGWDYLARFVVDQTLGTPDELAIRLSEIMSRGTGSGITDPTSLVSAEAVYDYQAYLVTVSSEAFKKAILELKTRHDVAMNSIRNLKG